MSSWSFLLTASDRTKYSCALGPSKSIRYSGVRFHTFYVNSAGLSNVVRSVARSSFNIAQFVIAGCHCIIDLERLVFWSMNILLVRPVQLTLPLCVPCGFHVRNQVLSIVAPFCQFVGTKSSRWNGSFELELDLFQRDKIRTKYMALFWVQNSNVWIQTKFEFSKAPNSSNTWLKL